ncbi:aromatic acid/H+ symport family MFS transporter [Burkholderia multivorans]|uniref:MFS transporter n=1 Tax=Burkholderia multivorans TaxID=87883 RepID=UPI000D357449|nr:aromatic acid/H+ symport family MFS transporter [Burkholderia multivorans]MBR8021383.1 aromatic acid/H+ symport family MFS transporter [Burkholderia multivorans]MEB2511898.1 aromatic acid/H+ symport family MFS transporter [Burkholderia multivorans]MEB2521496.1 aromatic acid/H+ symport family MFS transporter [Burkholderia multivorans]MEB2575371.1 aromatic acid/H+ symport family MFS transporter [Burkholderia multivorans]MEB2593472.1 aromatic acid/H+ symport family MFS transporter [Burkholderi
MNQATPPVRSSLFVVLLCFLTIVADGYDLIVYGATVPHLLAEPGWHLTPAGAGMIGSWTLVGLMVGLAVAGPLTDRIGRRRLLMVGVLWFSVGSFVCAFATSPTFLGAARFITGIGMGGVVPSAVALAVEYAPKGRRHFYNALTLTGYSVGGIVSALLAIVLLHEHGWRTLYALGALYALILPVMYFLLPESADFLVNRGRIDEARTLAARYSLDLDQILRDKDAQRISHGAARPAGGYRLVLSRQFRATALLLAFMTFCVQLIVYGLNAWLPQLMRAAGYPLGSSLQFLLVMQFGAVVGMLGGAWLADRVGTRRVMFAFLVLGGLSLIVLSQKLDSTWLMLAVFGAGLSSIGTSSLIYGYIAAHFPTSCRGSALGGAQAVGRFGSILGPMIGGWIVGANLGLHWNFYAFAIPAIVAATVVPLIPRSA